MTIDTNKFRELARGASGGEWIDDDETHEVRAGENCEYYVPEKANRAFIAAASPKAVLALLDVADQLRQACATWESIFGPARYENEIDRHFGDSLADVVAKHELAAGVHPASWLDCPACRALSKAGIEPSRCEMWIRIEKERADG